MDRGVLWARSQAKAALDLADSVPEFNELKQRLISEYYYFNNTYKTGDLYHYLKNFEDGNHKFAEDFKVFDEYGIYTNEKMVGYFEEHFQDELEHVTLIDDLVVGDNYNNYDIRNAFKCSYMGGMRRSKQTNSLVLIAKHVKNLYDDNWIDDVLHYTGEGQEGNQTLTGQNMVVYDSYSNGVRIYLFEVFEEQVYTYQGQVFLADTPYIVKQQDRNQMLRDVWIFPLKKVDQKTQIVLPSETMEKIEAGKIRLVKKLSIDELNEKVKYVRAIAGTRIVKTNYIERNQYVSEFTKKRSNGICDLCGKSAPFVTKDGSPYLETHHVITLADKGPDQIYNTVALCPNCHRKMHVMKSTKDLKKLTDIIYKYLLNEDEKTNVEKFEELFSEVINNERS